MDHVELASAKKRASGGVGCFQASALTKLPGMLQVHLRHGKSNVLTSLNDWAPGKNDEGGGAFAVILW